MYAIMYSDRVYLSRTGGIIQTPSKVIPESCKFTSKEHAVNVLNRKKIEIKKKKEREIYRINYFTILPIKEKRTRC